MDVTDSSNTMIKWLSVSIVLCACIASSGCGVGVRCGLVLLVSIVKMLAGNDRDLCMCLMV